MDTNSIIISHYFESQDILFGPNNYLSGFDEYFLKYTPNYIFRNELNRALTDYEDNFRDMVMRNVTETFCISHYSEWNTCLHYVEWWLTRNHYRIAEGEKRCLSLALYLSRNKNSTIYLLSDDFRAIDIISEFMKIQRIGYANTTMDIVLEIYARKNAIRKEQVLMLFQEYRNLIPKLRGPIIPNTDIELLNVLCRLVGISRHICRQDCYNIF